MGPGTGFARPAYTCAMSPPTLPWPERYRPVRRSAEVAFWAILLLVQAAFNSVVTLIDLRSAGRPVAAWEPALWELSSVLVVGLLIPAIVAFERRFPLHWDTLRHHLPWHLVGSVAYCSIHLAGMMALRHLAYSSMGAEYRLSGPWWAQWGYEYLKDVRTYALIVSSLVGYRFLLLRLQGEARVLDRPEESPATPAGPPCATGPAAHEPPPPPPTSRPERFLVRKLRREFLIAASDIAWLQAEANYVGLHVNGHDYLVRSTLADFLTQLDPARFVRVHRSYAVNLDAVAEIEPLDSGDARLRMKDGSTVPCSRRYRSALAQPGAAN
ncbi:response regulator of the LytR/AlgR family [Acidovorax sp. CF316]|nr:response regulator of the LytR/AlgR family [Acidovorax sp. CF316]